MGVEKEEKEKALNRDRVKKHMLKKKTMQHQGMPELTMEQIGSFTSQQTEAMMASYTRQSQAASAGLAQLGEARRNMDVLHQQQNQNASSLNSDVGLMAYTGVHTEGLIQRMITAQAMAPSAGRPAPPESIDPPEPIDPSESIDGPPVFHKN
jgi:hypothetical protein